MSVGRVVEVDIGSDSRWDRFVLAQPAACGHHLAGWAQILHECYGFKPRYLALEEDDALVGVLPLVHSGRRLSGARLSSLPTSKSAGPLASSLEGERELLRFAGERASQEPTCALTVRSEHAELAGAAIGLQGTDHSYRLAPRSEDELLEDYRRGAKNLYRSIRKSEKAGLSVADTRSSADLREWYRLYLATIRRHGNFPRRLRQFQASMSLLGSAWRLAVVRKDGRVVAGGVFHDIGDTVELIYNASDEAYLSERPNHALYWRVLRDAALRGQGLDFGLAASESLRAFKEQWGAEPVPIYLYARAEACAELDRHACAADAETGSGLRARAEGAVRSVAIDALQRLPLSVNRAAGALAYRLA
ncbi:MAG: GNAT family N-acetyltransferase [Solirubrobacteraceae bacterium]